MLAGMALAAGAARNLVRTNPAEVDNLLAGLISDSRSATVDIRRLIYDLAPPALDRVGLAQALRTQVDRLSASDDPSSNEHLSVTVDASPDVVDLPADVEVAAFRIALEAFINVRRHAKARTCTIQLTVDGPLYVEVCDDGVGLPTDARLGVGLHSMEVRAAEVGGVCTVTSREGGGTRVHALLPIPALNLLQPVQARPGDPGRLPGRSGHIAHDGGTPPGAQSAKSGEAPEGRRTSTCRGWGVHLHMVTTARSPPRPGRWPRPQRG